MAKDLKEQIEIMTHYLNGGEVEIYDGNNGWVDTPKPVWEWVCFDYRIKEEKKTVTIEKWLCKNKLDVYYIVQSSDIDSLYQPKKVKLLETYKVEL